MVHALGGGYTLCGTHNRVLPTSRMKAQENAALADHLEWQQKMTARAEQRKKLEIEVQYNNLRKKVYKCAHDIATGWDLDCFYPKLTPPNSHVETSCPSSSSSRGGNVAGVEILALFVA